MSIGTFISNNELEQIEWHDARIEKLELHPEGNLKIHFKHLCVYRKCSEDQTEVWSFKAIVALKEVSSFNVDNIISDSYIDGELLDSEGNEVNPLPVQSEKAVSTFKIVVGGAGTNIDIRAKSAILEMLEPVKKLETVPS